MLPSRLIGVQNVSKVSAGSSDKMDGILDRYDKKVYDKLDKAAYNPPSASQILSAYQSFGNRGKHPRLLMSGEHVNQLKSELKDTGCDKYYWYKMIKGRADIICNALKNESQRADFLP